MREGVEEGVREDVSSSSTIDTCGIERESGRREVRGWKREGVEEGVSERGCERVCDGMEERVKEDVTRTSHRHPPPSIPIPTTHKHGS